MPLVAQIVLTWCSVRMVEELVCVCLCSYCEALRLLVSERGVKFCMNMKIAPINRLYLKLCETLISTPPWHMNLITRRPPEDSLGDAGAPRPPRSHRRTRYFCFPCRLCSTRPFPSSASCRLSRVSEASPLPRVGRRKKKVPSKDQTLKSWRRATNTTGGRKMLEDERARRESGGCGATSRWRPLPNLPRLLPRGQQ